MSFASDSDFIECARLHRKYGTTYYFSSRLFPAETRRRVDALYGFVRVPDEWVDNPVDTTEQQRRWLLEDYRRQLMSGLQGIRPHHPVLRAFVDVMCELDMSPEEPLTFLEAMESDLNVARYATYVDLEKYMRGSAAAVGLMMCRVLGCNANPSTEQAAMDLANAMQLTNFLRDVGEDFRRGRIYLPQDEMAQFGVCETSIARGQITVEFQNLMKFQIARARDLYRKADPGIGEIPAQMRPAVRAARELYAAILDRIERNNYDVFTKRLRTSRSKKLLTAARVLVLGQTSP
ncbi:MAG: phytoene/squalene synthase family protein [Armatimonadetes bacterium]|nr:phytoene/squalene synthase family protein [Armatimonadota bacterium]